MGRKIIPGYHPGGDGRQRRGEDGSRSLKEQGFYHTPAWRKLRRMALQRDHYLCQKCLRRGKNTQATEVHHILELESFPSLGLELSNLESLCWQCHEETKHHKASLPDKGVRIIRITNGDGENRI